MLAEMVTVPGNLIGSGEIDRLFKKKRSVEGPG
jgi:hypothetical protein